MQNPTELLHLPRAPLPLNIDSTMMACARGCLQKFFLEFCHGYRPRALSVDLHAGATFAIALEETYRHVWVHNRSLQDALDRAHAAALLYWGDFEIPEYKKTAKTFDRMWEAIVGDGTADGKGYFEMYDPKMDHVQPYFENGKPTFEYTFAIPLGPVGPTDDGHCFPLHPSGEPFLYSGRFDMLGNYAGMPIVRDEKTTGNSIGVGWADQWTLRSQFMGYVWACQQSGMKLDSVCVRGISILKTKINHAEAIKSFEPFKIQMWHEQLRRDLWRIRRAYDENYFDYNLADACSSYGGCVFRDVCATPYKNSFLADYEVRHWNPILKNPVGDLGKAVAA